MLELWLKLHKDDNKIRFILLTNSDPHSLPSDVTGIDEFGKSLQVHNLPRSEVFSILSIADIAFLLRDERDLIGLHHQLNLQNILHPVCLLSVHLIQEMLVIILKRIVWEC